MNKTEFLDELRQRLSDFSPQNVAQPLEYYEEMLNDRMDDGLSEQDAVEAIGTPECIAERIRMELPLPTIVRARASKARRMKGWEIVLLILGSPVWLPVLLSVFIVLLCLYVVIWAIVISLYAVDLALSAAGVGLFGWSIWTLTGQDIMHGTFLLGASLICIALAILLFLVSKLLTKAVIRGTAALGRKCKRRIVGKGRAS